MNRLQFKNRNKIKHIEKKLRHKAKAYLDKSCPKCGLVVKDHTFNIPYNRFSCVPKRKNRIICQYCRAKLYGSRAKLL